jgi:tRNA(Ile2) C34 agmatinyltransferase TiaS
VTLSIHDKLTDVSLAEAAGGISKSLRELAKVFMVKAINPDGVPACPTCGQRDGSLGTSFAYFICDSCGVQYWTPDHQHPGDWAVAVTASPWATRRHQLEQTALALDQAAYLLEVLDKDLKVG